MHITSNKDIGEKYIRARTNNDSITLNNITNRHPVRITLPVERPRDMGYEYTYVSVPLRKKVAAIEKGKNRTMAKNLGYNGTSSMGHASAKKEEGAINGVKIFQQEIIKRQNKIFPQKLYTQAEYIKFWE